MDEHDTNDEQAPEQNGAPPPKPPIAPSADVSQRQPAASDAPASEQDDYEAANKETADYSHVLSVVGEPKPRKSRHWFVVILLLLLIGGGAADWWFFIRQKPAPPQTQTTQGQQQASNSDANQAPATKKYDSSEFDLTFSYPETWKVDDTQPGRLKVVSPALQLTDATGQQQTGQVVVNLQKKDAADLGAFKQGDAIAVLNSKKVSYTQPTSTQRKATYISYLQYAATTTRGALDSMYVTGDYGYKYGQLIPQADIVQADPLITVTFFKCADEKCANKTKPTPMSLQSSSWQADPTAKQLMTMLQSLQVK